MWNSAPSPGFKWRPKLGYYTDGQNNKFDLENFEATSYKWWTYVSKIKGKVVFNSYPYSSTTSNHQRNMRSLLKQLGIKIDVEVSMRQSLSNFWSDSLPSKYESLFHLEIKLTRANKKNIESIKKDIADLKAEIKVCRQLGAKMPMAKIMSLKASVKESDARRLEAARIERAETKALRASLKPELHDFGPVMTEFDDAENFDSIKI